MSQEVSGENSSTRTPSEGDEPESSGSNLDGDVTDDTVNLILTTSSSSGSNVQGRSSPVESNPTTSHPGPHTKKSALFVTEDETSTSSTGKKILKPVGATSPSENRSNESVVDHSHVSSTSSIICRICQLTETETGEPVKTSDCHCKGYLDAIHRSCLLEWIRYKGTRVCEVCASDFTGVPDLPTRTASDEARQQELESIFRQYASLRPLTRKKRAFIGSLLVFLTLMSAVAGVLTVSSDKRFHSIATNPNSSIQNIKDSYVMFSICLSFLLFCSALTFGTLLTWCTLEISYSYQRQRVWQRAVRIAAHNQNRPA